MPTIMVTTEEFEKANRLGARLQRGPTAVEAFYDENYDRVIVNLSTGVGFLLNPRNVQELEHASTDDLDSIEITPSRLSLYFPKLDVGLYLPALLKGVFGSKSWAAAQLGAGGGAVTSEAKTTVARANGARGGRPPKTD